MADSQPGKVATFDPSITLADFAADKRAHLMYNENQLVLAKVQQTAPVSSYAQVDEGTKYSEYKNTDGEYVYIDSSFQALSTSGKPSLDINRIVVGFDRQVTTSEIKFWATQWYDSADFSVDYSFDDETYFTAGTITWTSSFDDTIQVNPSDDPPTGEWVYTGTINSGPLTARYWKVKTSASDTASKFGEVTEVRILQTTLPLIQHWNSDGVKAVPHVLEGENFYHLAYDKTDDVYYALKLDFDLRGTPPTPNATFDDGNSPFDPELWIEDETNVYFTKNVTSGTLDYVTSAGQGQLDATYGMVSDFTAVMEFVSITQQDDESAYFALQTEDFDTGNQSILAAIKGPYLPNTPNPSAGLHPVEYIEPAEGGAPQPPSWFGDSTLPGSIGTLTSVAMDGNNIVHYRYYSPTTGSDTYEIYSTSLDLSWSAATFSPESDLEIVFGQKIALALESGILVVCNPANTINGIASGRAAVYIDIGGTWVFEQYIAPSDNAANWDFGTSVSISNGVIAVGAPGAGGDAGAVYTFTSSGSTWTQQQKVTTASSVRLGQSVAIDGTTLVVGGPLFAGFASQAGAVYVYVYSASWVIEQILEASNKQAGDQFGYSVSVHTDTIVVGAPFTDSNGDMSGSAYMFNRVVTTWTEVEELTATDASSNDRYGEHVAINDQSVIVVAPNNSGNAIYTYSRSSGLTWIFNVQLADVDNIFAFAASNNGIALSAPLVYAFKSTTVDPAGGWAQRQEVLAANVIGSASYGTSVATTSDISVVGVHTSNTNGLESGAAYVFKKDNLSGEWLEVAQLSPLDPTEGKKFGYSVDITEYDNTIIVGAIGDTDNGVGSGAAYLFAAGPGDTWSMSKKLVAGSGIASEAFGTSVAIDVDTVVVGVPGDSTTASGSGAAHIIDRAGGAWIPQTLVSGTALGAGDSFGHTVSVSGDRVAIGAPYNDVGGTDAGVVYVYERNGGSWSEEDTVSTSVPGDLFGSSVSVYDAGTITRLIVGAPSDDYTLINSGAAYIYDWSGSEWLLDTRIQPVTKQEDSLFGNDVSLYKNTVAVGSPHYDSELTNAGQAYIFEKNLSLLTWESASTFGDTQPVEHGNFSHAVAVASGTVATVDLLEIQSPYWVGATVDRFDTFDGSVSLQDFRIHGEDFDFSKTSGLVTYTITYNSSTENYTVSVDGTPLAAPATAGTPYVSESSVAQMSFTLAELFTPADGQQMIIYVRFDQEVVQNPTTTSGIQLQVERIGSNSFIRYSQPGDPGFTRVFNGNINTGSVQRPQIFGNSNSAGVDISIDNFSVSAAETLRYESPVLSVVTLDKTGFMTEVVGVSDSDGYVIKRLDIIKDVTAKYNDFMTPVTGIATNAGVGGSGSIFIKFKDKLWKFIKSALPLDLEDGSSASSATVGEIPESGISGFGYNGYTQAGLTYIQYLQDLDGVFMKTIKETDLTAVTNKVWLDVPTSDYPFAWNVSDLATLYYVDGDALKLYDLNETKAAFAVVSSDKQVLAAGTQESAIVTAQVLNVYGEPKSNKTMTFSVSLGDGAVSPALTCSDVDGKATTTYVVGAAIGSATITVTVSDLTC